MEGEENWMEGPCEGLRMRIDMLDKEEGKKHGGMCALGRQKIDQQEEESRDGEKDHASRRQGSSDSQYPPVTV